VKIIIHGDVIVGSAIGSSFRANLPALRKLGLSRIGRALGKVIEIVRAPALAGEDMGPVQIGPTEAIAVSDLPEGPREVTEQGDVRLPDHVRQALGLSKTGAVRFAVRADGIVEVRRDETAPLRLVASKKGAKPEGVP